MSKNSYELRRQKIETVFSEQLQELRGERHFSKEDVDTLEETWLYKCAASFAGGIILAVILMTIAR